MNEYDDILIAIHGIGAQSRNSTVRSVATRLATSAAATEAGEFPPLAPQPLGWFHTDVRGAVKVAPLDSFDNPKRMLARTGFTEVFWADIPQDVVKEGRTIEETKAWARTVVARARAIFKKKFRTLSTAEQLAIGEPDFSLAAEVLEEIIDTVYVLENLCFIAEKAGVMKFDLDDVLEEYLGDVQIVTEFGLFRRDIVGRFHAAMEQIHRDNPDAKLHVVAHSEGTVVSFLGLLHALSGECALPSIADSGAVVSKLGRVPSWLKNVRGYMTIGSPIDKHILMWPHLFETFDFTVAAEVFQSRPPILWRNYYDYGDPVGFKLETARKWLSAHGECKPFDFEEKHDFGFARYLAPGKAHNDYWDDPAVFEHFIVDVVKGTPAAAKKPESRRFIPFLSTAIPYFLSFAIVAVATFILYHAVSNYTHPTLDSMQRYLRYSVFGLAETSGLSAARTALHALAIAGLVAGVTLLARVPRLAVGAVWWLLGFLAFAVGCASYFFGVLPQSRDEIGSVFRRFGDPWPTLGVLVLALGVALFALLVKIPSHEFGSRGATPRKQRWIFKGMRPLIVAGAVAIALLVLSQFLPGSDLTPYERSQLSAAEIRQIQRAHLRRGDLNMLFWPAGHFQNPENNVRTAAEVLTVHPSAWPVLLSGAAFLYLWWLAALIFDLAFVWHRYIRNSVTNNRLMQWRGYQPMSAPASDAGKPVSSEA